MKHTYRLITIYVLACSIIFPTCKKSTPTPTVQLSEAFLIGVWNFDYSYYLYYDSASRTQTIEYGPNYQNNGALIFDSTGHNFSANFYLSGILPARGNWTLEYTYNAMYFTCSGEACKDTTGASANVVWFVDGFSQVNTTKSLWLRNTVQVPDGRYRTTECFFHRGPY